MQQSIRNNSTSIIAILYLIWLLSGSLYSQEYPAGKYDFPDQPNGSYFKSYWGISKAVVTSPLKWDKKQWVATGGVVTAGVVLYIYDDEIRDFFQRNQSNGLSNISKFGLEPLGSGVYPAILLGGTYVYGLAAHNSTARQIALGGTQAWMMGAVTAQVIKLLTQRHRPYQDVPGNPRLWKGPFKSLKYTSFPSGHTITAFSLAAFLSSVYKDRPWVAVVSYGLATGVGLSRVYDDQHWASDVFIGAALGFAIGKLVFRTMQPNSKISMAVGPDGGIGLVYKF
jgi:membrane-associated phospholipid phosphatase